MLEDEQIPTWAWLCSVTAAIFINCGDVQEVPWPAFTAMLP
jgi:hypothetical protein